MPRYRLLPSPTAECINRRSRSRPLAVCCPLAQPTMRGWTECATAGSHRQSGESSLAPATNHNVDAERRHSAENDDPCLVPYFVTKCFPNTLLPSI